MEKHKCFWQRSLTAKQLLHRREELILMEEHECFWQRSLTAKQLLHGAKGSELQTLTLSPLLGGSSLGVFLHFSIFFLRSGLLALRVTRIFEDKRFCGHSSLRKNKPKRVRSRAFISQGKLGGRRLRHWHCIEDHVYCCREESLLHAHPTVPPKNQGV